VPAANVPHEGCTSRNFDDEFLHPCWILIQRWWTMAAAMCAGHKAGRTIFPTEVDHGEVDDDEGRRQVEDRNLAFWIVKMVAHIRMKNLDSRPRQAVIPAGTRAAKLLTAPELFQQCQQMRNLDQLRPLGVVMLGAKGVAGMSAIGFGEGNGRCLFGNDSSCPLPRQSQLFC